MFNISSCTSQNSTSILSCNMDLPSSSSSSSSSSSTFVAGGRALDRHNPIITDEKRSGGNSSSKPGTPCTHNILQEKPKTPVPPSPKPTPNSPLSRRKKVKNTNTNTNNNNNKALFSNSFRVKYDKTVTKKVNVPTKPKIVNNEENDHNYEDVVRRKSFSKPSELIMKAAACNTSKPGVDYTSSPESSRYLLDDTSFLDVLSDFDPFLKLAPYGNNNNNAKHVDDDVSPKFDVSKPPKTFSSASETSDQVVVLRVSLHCRGCERKMKKYLSKMPGVSSFNIDFAAKKVTVTGDVTPLGVLASISKVKTAKLWAPPAAMSSFRNIEVKM